MSGKPGDWQRAQGRWRKALMEARALTATDRLVALAMLEAANRQMFLDGEGLVSWLGVETIATQLGFTGRGVRKARQNLVACGAIRLEIGRGGRPKAGAPKWAAECFFNIEWLETRNPGSANSERGFHVSHENAEQIDRKPGTEAPKTRNPGSAHSLDCEPHEEKPLDVDRGTPPLFADQDEAQPVASMEPKAAFDKWWPRYPRKKDKAAAWRAFKPALKKASLPELLAATDRYAVARHGQPKQFTKHPATWLNGECWLNAEEIEDAADSKITNGRGGARERDHGHTPKGFLPGDQLRGALGRAASKRLAEAPEGSPKK